MASSAITIIPAYGRDYETEAEATADWNEGKDFRIADISSRWNGSYISKRLATKYGVSVMLRYNKLERVAIV